MPTRLLIVDDGSRDDTRELAQARAAADPRVRVLVHDVNRGYGAAVRTGLAAARLEWIFLTDADLQFDVGELVRFVPLAQASDIIAGYRTRRADPPHRLLNAAAWNMLVRRVFDVPLRDVDCAFKLMRRDVVQALPLAAEGAMVSTELITRAHDAGARIAELGVAHRPRTAGRSSGASPRVVLRAFRELRAVRADLREGAPARSPRRPVAPARGVASAPRLARPRPRGRGPGAGRAPAPDRARPRPDEPLLRRAVRSMGTSWAAFLSRRVRAGPPGGDRQAPRRPLAAGGLDAAVRLRRRGAAAARGARRRRARRRADVAAAHDPRADRRARRRAGAGRGALGGDRRAQRHDGRGHGRARRGRRGGGRARGAGRVACGRWPGRARCSASPSRSSSPRRCCRSPRRCCCGSSPARAGGVRGWPASGCWGPRSWPRRWPGSWW